MSSIEERIVRMKFDNQGFEAGVQKTLGSLKKLGENLKMKNSGEGLTGITNKIKGLIPGMSGIGTSVDNVSSKFSALGVVGVTALMNLTNSAVNAGKRIISSFTIDPIKDGFREYETKMDSIQTILTNTAHQGTTLKQVTDVLNDLNTYSDKTIYNFAEMTRNIGTFTAAGVDLDTSVSSIKGIANLAAASGSSSAQAASAMYQLSQALAAGKVSMMDWNSVNTAGMGGKLFQDALIRTSENLGTGADKMIEKYGSFRESLTRGEWLTTEVLTETLKQLSGAYSEADLISQGYTKKQAQEIVQLAKNAEDAATKVKTFTQLIGTMKESIGSGWAQSWEYIFGNKDQATELFTGISDSFTAMIQPSADARNNMLKFWNKTGGRADVIKGFGNIFGGITKGVGAIKGAFDDIFPPMTGQKLVEISKGFLNLSKNFKMSDETAAKVKNTFKGVFSVIDLGKNIFLGLAKSASPLLTIFGSLGNMGLSITSTIGSITSSLVEFINGTGVINKGSNLIVTSFNLMGRAAQNLGKFIDGIFSGLSTIDFSGITNAMASAIKSLGAGIEPVLQSIAKVVGSIDLGKILQGFMAILASRQIMQIKEVVEGMAGIVEDTTSVFDDITEIPGKISETLDSVGESMEQFQNKMKAGTMIKIAIAVGVLAGALILLASIDAEKLATGLVGIAVLLGELVAAFAIMTTISAGTGQIFAMSSVSTALILMATAIKILASAMEKINDMDYEDILKGLTTIISLLGIMAVSVKVFSKSSKGLITSSIGLIVFAKALEAMADAIKKLGEIETEQMMSGLLGLGILLVELVGFMKVADFKNVGLTGSAGLVLLAGALLILSQAINAIGALKPEELIKGLVGVGVVLAELAIFTRFTGNATMMLATAAGITILSVALNIMAIALKSFGSMSWEEMIRGLIGLAGALAILGAASVLISGPMMLSLSVGISTMSIALMLLAKALDDMGDRSWQEVAIGLVTLAGALTILSVAMIAMSSGIAGAAAMLVMSAALALFVPQLVLLGQLPIQAIGVALIALAGSFTILGVAALVLAPLIPAMLGLAASIALLGVACLGVGAGVALLGTGLTALAAGTAAAGFSITELLRTIINMLPQIFTKLGEAIGAFADAITKSAPKVAKAGSTLVLTLLQTIKKDGGKMVQLGVDIIVNFMNGITKNAPRLANSATTMIITLVNAISRNLGRIVDAGIKLAIKFINAVADGISRNTGPAIAAVGNLCRAIGNAGLQALKAAASGFLSAGRSLVSGFANGIRSGAGQVWEAAKSLASKALNGLKSTLKINSPSKAAIPLGGSTSEGFAKGITRYAYLAKKSAEDMGKSVLGTLSDTMSRISDENIDANPVIRPVIDLSDVQKKADSMRRMMPDDIQVKTTGILSRSIGKIQNGNDNGELSSLLKDLKVTLDSTNNGNTYIVNGITYDDGTSMANAIETIVREATIERRV